MEAVTSNFVSFINACHFRFENYEVFFMYIEVRQVVAGLKGLALLTIFQVISKSIFWSWRFQMYLESPLAFFGVPSFETWLMVLPSILLQLAQWRCLFCCLPSQLSPVRLPPLVNIYSQLGTHFSFCNCILLVLLLNFWVQICWIVCTNFSG